MSIRKNQKVTPGEKMAVIEEFEAGMGAYSNGGAVRANALGLINVDPERRVITVRPARPMERLPSPGDEVVGQVEVSQSNMINARIYYKNGKRSQANLTSMIGVRAMASAGRGRSKKIVISKPGDLIRGKVVSNINAITHLSIDGDHYGVIHTVCSLCGSSVSRINNRIKCIECGHVEDRKLASDFGKIAPTLA